MGSPTPSAPTSALPRPPAGAASGAAATTVVPTVVPTRRTGPGPGAGARPAPPRPPLAPQGRPVRGRKAKLSLRRVDPWSVFVVSLMLSLLLAVMTVVAGLVLYTVLDAAGIPASINKSVSDVKGGTDVLTQGRFLGIAALLAAANVVLLTVLATLAALLYNLCASFTGGVEVTLAERD